MIYVQQSSTISLSSMKLYTLPQFLQGNIILQLKIKVKIRKLSEKRDVKERFQFRSWVIVISGHIRTEVAGEMFDSKSTETFIFKGTAICGRQA